MSLADRQFLALNLSLLVSLSAWAVETPKALASDWVEDNQSSFRLQQPVQHKPLAPGHSPNVSGGSSHHPDAPEVEVREDGPGAVGHPKAQSTILEGSARIKERNFTLGLTDQADQILAAAPRIPLPDSRNVGAAVFRGWLERTHGQLAQNSKESIVEIKGQWDDSGHILHAFGLSFTKIAPNQLTKTDLEKTSVIIVDCAGALNTESIKVIHDFVLNGGYLVTTDWALDGCLTRLTEFDGKGFLSWNSGYSYPDTVDAVVVDPIPELTTGCVPYARWRLDDKCQTVHIRDPLNVHVLVRSNILAKSDPDNKGILAATFILGQGKVLHIVGHFDNNSTNAFNTTLPDPEQTMGISLRQGIIANFVIAGLKAHGLGQTTTATDNDTDTDKNSAKKSK